MKTIWDKEEDEYCCEQFVKHYIVHKSFFDVSTFVYNLALKLKKDKGTIKMKISNIVYIVDSLKISHTCNCKPLSNFSEQNLIALANSLKKQKIDIDRTLLVNLIQKKFNA